MATRLGRGDAPELTESGEASIVMLVAATLLAATTLASRPAATLCMGGTCRPAGDRRAEVAATPGSRPFVWISPDATRMLAGVIPAGATIVPLASADSVTHKMTLATSDGSRNVSPRFELRCGDRTWKWSLAQLARQSVALQREPGACTMRVSADGYKVIERELSAPALGLLYLHRLPILSGEVIDAVTRAPIARAEVFLPGGDLLAVTDGAGRFRKPLDGAWPGELRIDAAGYAKRFLAVPRRIADIDLPIALSRGGSVKLTLAPPLGQEDVRWELRRIIRDVEDKAVRSGSVVAGVSTVTIEAIEPGPYRIVIAGDGPLQRMAVPFLVEEGMLSDVIAQITPSRLDLRVTMGGAPYPDATVEMIFRRGDAAWRSEITIDERGEAAEEIWQSGEYIASVGLAVEHRSLSAGEASSWAIDLSERSIRGRVSDAPSGSPLRDVLLLLETSGMQTAAQSAADGTFEFRHVPAGAYSLTVRSRGHRERVVRSATGTGADEHDLRLERETGHVLRAVSFSGVPLVAAHVWIATRAGTRPAGVTGDDGRITLPLAQDEHGLAYVLPRSGSFAVIPFASIAERGVEEVLVTVPAATAALELMTLTTDGIPLPGVPFLMRVNGTAIPMAVYEAMVEVQGLPLFSDASGRAFLSALPPGRYEIWPLTSPADRRAVESPAPPPAPVNVMLTPGHHVAKLTFRPKAS